MAAGTCSSTSQLSEAHSRSTEVSEGILSGFSAAECVVVWSTDNFLDSFVFVM